MKQNVSHSMSYAVTPWSCAVTLWSCAVTPWSCAVTPWSCVMCVLPAMIMVACMYAASPDCCHGDILSVLFAWSSLIGTKVNIVLICM